MTADERHPLRKTIRLFAESYEQRRAYFVTVCTHEKQCLLSDVDGQFVGLSKRGELVRSAWLCLPDKFPALALDEYILMPNHLHAILCLVGAGLARPSSEVKAANHYSLIDVMRVFKSVSTIQVNREFKTPGAPLWQRSYFDHIIRDAEDLRNHRKYIIENPMRWSAKERDYPPPIFEA